MTLQDVGRARRKGGDGRARPNPKDRLPQPRAVAGEVRELRMRLSVFAEAYAVEHDGLVSLGSADVHVMSSPDLTTVEAAVDDANNQAARDRLREAVEFLRKAATNVDSALRAFGPNATQAMEPSRDSVVNYSTFRRAVNREEHFDRERKLRSS